MADPDTTYDGSRGQVLLNGTVTTVPAKIPQITPDDIRSIQISNDDLKKLESSGVYSRLGSEPGADKSKDAQLATAEAAMAHRMGLTETPPVFVDSNMHGAQTFGSGETKEGKPYIAVSADFLKAYSPQQQQAFIGLELDRLKNRDESPTHMAAALNDPRIADQDTYRADRNASGPAGTCHPEVLAAAIAAGDELRRQGLRAAGEAHPGPDPEHPHSGLRIDQLNQQKAQQDASGVCRGR